MPVVNKTSNLYRDSTAEGPSPDPLELGGYIRRATGKVINAADDASGSTYKLISLPGYVILLPGTFFVVDGWGFADVRIGTKADNDAFLTVTRAAAATQSPITPTEAAEGTRLYQMVGNTDPMEEVHFYAHAIANATGAGEMRFVVEWVDNI